MNSQVYLTDSELPCHVWTTFEKAQEYLLQMIRNMAYKKDMKVDFDRSILRVTLDIQQKVKFWYRGTISVVNGNATITFRRTKYSTRWTRLKIKENDPKNMHWVERFVI